jgi:Ca-activated chloride channel homolog
VLHARNRIVVLAIAAARLHAAEVFLHGKVVTDDGSAPGRVVTIEKLCTDHIGSIPVASSSPRGDFTFHVSLADVELVSFNRSCVLRAALKGYQSTSIDFNDWKAFQDPNLPPITLIKRSTNPTVDLFNDTRVPARAVNAWVKAGKAANASHWSEAERELRAAVLAAPKFAQGWNALGTVLKNEHKLDEARQAEQRAVELNPKLESAHLLLARFDIEAKDWAGARTAADALIELDARHRYLEAYIHQAIARFQLKDAAGAEASIQEAIRLDRKRDFPRTEYILGMILEARRETEGARQHLRTYLQLEPKAYDAAEVQARIEHINDHADAPPVTEIAQALEYVAAELQLAPAGEAWVPGGIKALAAAAGVPGDLSYQNFFTEFCRTLTRESSPGLARGIPHYQDGVLAYIASISELGRAGQHHDDKTMVTISLAGEAQRASAGRVLNLLGWKLAGEKNVEPGDQPADGFRQRIPSTLGIDELAMQRTLEAGRTFEFAAPSESARLIGGDAWGRLVKDLPFYPGGIAEAFVRDPRLAKVYAGLGAMGSDTAGAVVSAVGLQALVEQYADVLARYPEAFASSRDGAAVPGDEAAWKKLAGASPRTAPAFFRALLDRDFGSLAAFLTVLQQADAAHQKFFTATPARAEKFYAWYRDSGEPRWSLALDRERWRGDVLRNLPLDASGNVRFPGGKRAWTEQTGSDEDVLLKLPALAALVPVASIEERRQAPLDEPSARLLADHFSQWRALFPYFEAMPALGRGEFAALAAFTEAVSNFPRERQNAVLGEWDSLVELIARAKKAGALDAARSARLFRSACESLTGADPAVKAAAIYREIGGAEALRLGPDQQASLQRVIALQSVPETVDSKKIVTALSGIIYAASLPPDALLLSEDPRLLSKHQFATDPLFSPAKLVRSSGGSYLSGTFVNIDQLARDLVRAESPAPRDAPAAPDVPAPGGDDEEKFAADFRAEGRLVEVYATVTDSRGRYVDDLKREQFSVLESGRPRPLDAFESRSSELSVALLLDTTGSMWPALPALKVAALNLIGQLRAEDRIAVYSFNDKVSELLPFSADKDAARRAVLAAQPIGETALYDALARVNRDLAARTGKKVMVVFTDGDDNASTLTADTAIQRAKAAGVPVYTIAQGAALSNPVYLKQLADVSRATGGVSYAIHSSSEIRGVFEKISEDLMHTYFFAFRPQPAENHEYRPIEVAVHGGKNYKVRARDGYYPQ